MLGILSVALDESSRATLRSTPNRAEKIYFDAVNANAFETMVRYCRSGVHEILANPTSQVSEAFEGYLVSHGQDMSLHRVGHPSAPIKEEHIMIRMKYLCCTVAAACISLAPGVNAQTTLDQQKRTAKILSNGMIESGGGWISSVSHDSTGAYTVNFVTPFTAPPNCVIAGESQAGGAQFILATIRSSSPGSPQTRGSVSVSIKDQANNVFADAPFRISCIPDQTVATSAAAWTAAGVLTVGSDWISSVTPAGVGTYVIAFRTPYLSTPVCVANVPANGSPAGNVQVNPSTTGATVFTQTISVINLLAVQVATTAQANRAVNLTCVGAQ